MKRGFTLIEIMLALLVISVGVVAVIGLLGTSLGASAKAHDDLEIASFADMVFNHYQATTNWNEIPPDGWSVPSYDGNPIDLASGSYDLGNQPISFELVANNPISNIKELTLKIWPGYTTNGTPRIFYAEIYNWTKTP